MARSTPTKKEQTHERIVRSAARAIREHGYEGVSVVDMMKEAGLTHGGFYAHFPSRDALMVEALDAAGAESMSQLADAARKEPPAGLEALLELYLSDAHAAHPEGGCTLAALGSETARQSPEVRAVATRRVREMLEIIEKSLPKGRGRRERALGTMSAMVGALLVSRIVDDESLARSFRTATKNFVRDEDG